MIVLYILLALLLFGFLIFIHELGHFLAARACGVEVNEFSIGMGPKLVSWQSKKHPTRFSLRLLPIGGYISMVGEEEAPEGRRYRKKAESQKPEEKNGNDGTASESASQPADAVQPEEKDTPASEDDDTIGESAWYFGGSEMPDDRETVPGPVRAEPEPAEPEMSEEEIRQEQDEQQRREAILSDEHAYCNKKVWQRLIIVLAGPMMNLLLGFLLMVVVVLMSGYPASTVIAEFREDAVSSTYGLQVGDEVKKVGSVSVHSGNELVYEILYNGNEPLDLVVVRDGKKITLKDVQFPTFTDEESGVVFGDYDFKVYAQKLTFGRVMYHAFWRSVSTVKMVFDSLGGLLTGRFGIKSLSGPVGITKTIADAAKTSALSVMNLFVIISINLGIMNLLPIPSLDGSKVIFLLIEQVRGKPVKREVEGVIHLVGILLLFGLMIFITFKDIAGLF